MNKEQARELEEKIIYRSVDRMKEKEMLIKELGQEDILKELPTGIIKGIKKRIDMLKKWGIKEDKIPAAVNFFSRELAEIYKDIRFDIPCGTYLRLMLRESIDEHFAKNMSLSVGNNLALLSFDVNGLKTINDIFSHSTGDEYLQRIASTLINGNTTKKIQNDGINTCITSNGGDEFSIIISSPPTLPAINFHDILKSYEQEVSNIDCSDLVNFKGKETKSFFTSEVSVPENFSFKASVSTGFSTLQEVLSKAKLEELCNYDYALKVIIGEMLDKTDTNVQENKRQYKEKLSQGSKEEQFLALFLARNKENILAEMKIKRLEKELEQTNNNH